MKKTEVPWVEEGYRVFAIEGPQSIKIERLSKQIGKNKSSFYHLFADLEIFTEVLLSYHFEQATIMAEKEAKCGSLEELIQIILDHQLDLLFNRQLRVHRENPAFEKCFCEVNSTSIPAILGIWSEIMGLQENSHLSSLMLTLSLENFFLQITQKTLNRPWLENYFREIRILIREFKKTGPAVPLNGSV